MQAGIAQTKLHFTDDTAEAVEASDYLFICVGTPAAADGSAELQYVMSVTEAIAAQMISRKVVVNKSTVPVGTADKVAECMAAALAARGAEIPFEICSNPEFIKESSAAADALRPDRIIIGSRSEARVAEFRRMYESFNRNQDKRCLWIHAVPS